MHPARRALLAVDAEAGTLAVTDLSRAQSSRLFEVSSGYVATIMHMTVEERIRIRAMPELLSGEHNRPREITDAAVISFVHMAGADRILAALDELTAPTLIAAE
jgi:hypothetical protein